MPSRAGILMAVVGNVYVCDFPRNDDAPVRSDVSAQFAGGHVRGTVDGLARACRELAVINKSALREADDAASSLAGAITLIEHIASHMREFAPHGESSSRAVVEAMQLLIRETVRVTAELHAGAHDLAFRTDVWRHQLDAECSQLRAIAEQAELARLEASTRDPDY